MIQKNVKIMSFGKTLSGLIIPYQKIKFPKGTPIYLEFDNTKILGTATNFKTKKDGVYCDLEFSEKLTDTIAPELHVNENNSVCSNIELTGISFIKDHDCEGLNGNLL